MVSMTDRKPPRLASAERETLLALLGYQRESLCRKVEGVTDEAARTSAVGSGTTLFWLIKHMARAEALWVLVRFAGRPDAARSDAVSAEDSLASAVADYRSTWAQVDDVIRAHPLEEEARPDGDLPPVNLRWVVMHLLEETARHAGHADILRELIDGATGR